ncbi:DNA polymerase III subunit gamma/tau [Helicobacter winghamensis]|uniref:DNA polymerase III subunit gamma/tau n=1 Tax=Helicobacter winghamensis TaxID=157268 RepID=A0A2N3PHQ7_9HELI|nr:DNA polymerase III subunit gamma/tau [Helicobacter winghamensis]EEO25531.1 DNA polymerase III, subunit gamma and tau [Helicobacter winghamensis ATCC BAA-430]PKT78049.1 DNA polymerase III subunit gamma/tau [Helicobacter winghamensis]PKT78314.1 DNA polymerase III subunit gamma/tau [Helicobacter winghamensis]PKT78577.1 DNA polymerase III subunit gamma/tau [Helicobacter winghamensis]PKT80094.1 DNA polymerase III subunit gamma/tau [Helicobacter winghamensis]
MEQQALALKYRPMDFDELVGQEAVSRTLSLALDSKRLSHAYLFSGLRGSGKTSSARIFARALQCESGPRSKPCGTCANCLAANPHKMSHIDIMELDGASNRKIDDIRDLIEQTKYHPNIGRFKIFIIDEVHMLTREAFNALLKTLEEPPEYVKFILATTDPLKLPATILSRTQHFRFKRISDRSIFEHLKKILQNEQIPYQEEALGMLIRSGAGSLRDTLTLLDQAIIYSSYNVTSEVCANMLGLINAESLNALFECIFTQDRDSLLKMLEGFFEYECGMLLDEMSIFLKEKLLKGNDTRYSSLLIDRFFRIITQAKELLFLGSENEFVLTLSAFKMLEALKVESIDIAIAHLEKGFFESLPKFENTQSVAQKLESKTQISQIQTQTRELESQKEIPTLESAKKEAAQAVLMQQNMESKILNSNLTEQNITQDSIQDHAKTLFALLGKKISAHNYDLGEIFASDVRFVSFEDSVLTWETLAVGKNRERLIGAYSIIKNYVLEVFGMQTQIKNISKPREEIKEVAQIQNMESKTPQNVESKNLDSTLTPQEKIQREVTQALQSPLLQSAQELLEIKQVKVRPLNSVEI